MFNAEPIQVLSIIKKNNNNICENRICMYFCRTLVKCTKYETYAKSIGFLFCKFHSVEILQYRQFTNDKQSTGIVPLGFIVAQDKVSYARIW